METSWKRHTGLNRQHEGVPLQILFDKHTEDGQRTMHNVHGSDVKTRKAEKIDLFTNAKLGTRAVPQNPAKESSFPRFIERDSEAANATSQIGLCSDTKHQQRQQQKTIKKQF